MWQPAPIGTPSGKVIISFLDGRLGYGKYRLYISKISPTGSWEWGPKAVSVCTVDNAVDHHRLCLDGSKEGVFVCWVDYREYETTGRTAIYCARVDKEGKVVFEKKVGEGTDPVIVPSNQSCIVFWLGKERDTVGVYGQRVSSQGELLWGEPKLIIPEHGWLLENFQRLPGGVLHPYAISDMRGGALVYYYHGPERIDSLGNRYGIYYTFPFSTFNHIISNGTSGLIGTTGGPVRLPSGEITQRVYITQIEGDGDIPWGKADIIWENPNPRPDTEPFPDLHPTVARGYHKSYVVAWSAETNTSLGEDIFFQRIDSLGRKVYEKPLVICRAKDTQHYPYVVESDNGWWIIWEDLRDRDVNYLRRLCRLIRKGRDRRGIC